ncbi:MAG: GNAT family N-acetyltransferase [Bacteroidetes bacterium]|nr:GNAT family N-acetyltransferase [Bacteroidota bacterium]
MEAVFLKTDRYILRSISEDDLNIEYLKWLNDEEVCKYNSHATFPYTESMMIEYFDAIERSIQSKVVLAIIDKESGIHIGNVSLQNINWVNRNAEFAIMLGNTSFWGKGVGFEVAQVIFRYGFERLNLKRIYCGTSEENIGMQHIAQKLGMQHEGTHRCAMFKFGQYKDIFTYGILYEEFFK